MPKNNVANVKQWLDRSDVDYFTHFVKAWIPFNAWYRNSYESLEQEREILDQIKTDGNRIRSRFMAKLEGGDPDSEEIRNHIAQLHRRLSADPLKDHRGRRIGFENVSVGRNPKTKESFLFYNWNYIVERRTAPQKVVCEITNKSGIVVQTVTQIGGWDEEEFLLNPEYLKLDARKRAPLLNCYRAVNPYLFRSLLAQPTEKNSLEMDGYKFVRDAGAIFAGVVDVLYALRNLLFHGELVPDMQTNRTYEPAFHLLRHLTGTIA